MVSVGAWAFRFVDAPSRLRMRGPMGSVNDVEPDAKMGDLPRCGCRNPHDWPNRLLAFLGVVGFFAYLVWRFIVDKMNGW
ncbi:MAG: hypothetical protein EBT22_07335 [Chloroflexi bacterium]|nr:hypothetical protein [Chloroflexota bacterium]